MSHTSSRTLYRVALLSMLLAGPAFAADQGATDSNQIRVKAMADAMRTANGFAAAVQAGLASIENLALAQKSAFYEVVVQHPDRLVWTATLEDGSSCTGDFDDQTLTIDNPMPGSGDPVRFEGPVDGVLDTLDGRSACALPIAGLLRSDLLKTAGGIVLDQVDLGSEQRGTVEFHEIAMRRADIAWEFTAATPLPTSLHYRATLARDNETGAYVVTFQAWDKTQFAADPAAVSELTLRP